MNSSHFLAWTLRQKSASCVRWHDLSLSQTSACLRRSAKWGFLCASQAPRATALHCMWKLVVVYSSLKLSRVEKQSLWPIHVTGSFKNVRLSSKPFSKIMTHTSQVVASSLPWGSACLHAHAGLNAIVGCGTCKVARGTAFPSACVKVEWAMVWWAREDPEQG